ncbi:hypothetical protein KZX37_00130 [Microbacterium sp. EYE_5]|uniref:hypothetical protein n=1 Tax=unclassified Microbacterium TaxID=2609290 RepID=UPI0020033FA9|nr:MULTISPECIES: hypothetical protein [unclassified Microbacterium]MCK6079019.1 hypothetical protein [Microbacterium sp. EYE_382]MCK6084289.1 hypothetical protein [Microbacterium sp. EYE_384]MCK6123482.1 hypothetical protein [Microbacterium sp. EYE_80]MCK6125053.1 hypothetical protein [Microbacterium sp. EYE_79]MCK6142883.1 hypothetical protein [Microbacterium sp. EYE_39]
MSTSAEGLPHQQHPHSASGEPRLTPHYTPDDRVAPEDASLLWPDAHLLAEPPPGYHPLEMPAVWEPDAGAPDAWAQPPHPSPSHHHPAQTQTHPQHHPAQSAPVQQPWPYAPYAPHSQQPAAAPPAPEPHGPVAGYVISAQYENSAAQAGRPARAGSPAQGGRPAAGPPVPRSFRDLRSGPLEGREFPTMREFAVAAVIEAGYAEADVARLFRFAPWQLRAWVDEARNASFGPGNRPAHGPGRSPA